MGADRGTVVQIVIIFVCIMIIFIMVSQFDLSGFTKVVNDDPVLIGIGITVGTLSFALVTGEFIRHRDISDIRKNDDQLAAAAEHAMRRKGLPLLTYKELDMLSYPGRDMYEPDPSWTAQRSKNLKRRWSSAFELS